MTWHFTNTSCRMVQQLSKDKSKSVPVKITKETITSKRKQSYGFRHSVIVLAIFGIALAYCGDRFFNKAKFSDLVSSITNKISRALEDDQKLADGKLIPRYKSDIVKIEAQVFLRPQECIENVPTILSQSTHVKDAMKLPKGILKSQNQVFIVLSGKNEGLYVS